MKNIDRKMIFTTGDAYLSGQYLRLPTEDGKPSVFALTGDWYEAPAVDPAGNEFTVYWKLREDGEANWEHPTAVVQNDPWRAVTDQVRVVIGG